VAFEANWMKLRVVVPANEKGDLMTVVDEEEATEGSRRSANLNRKIWEDKKLNWRGACFET
jgi:hypothetical protein